MPRADRPLPFTARVANHEDATPKRAPPTLKKRVRAGEVSYRSHALRLAQVHSPVSKHLFEVRQTDRFLLPGQLHRIAELRRSAIPFHRRDAEIGRRRDSQIV